VVLSFFPPYTAMANKGGNAKQLDVVAKGAKIVEIDEEDIVKNPLEDLPPVVQRRVKALKNLQKTHFDLEKKYRDEVEALELKYQKLYEPIFEKRASIVKGQHEPTDEEARVEGEEPLKVEKADKEVKGIPNFWLQVMKNNVNIGDTITAADEEVLNTLQDIKYAALEGDKKGFVLTFHFAENAYFTDSVLTKTYYLAEDEGLFGELVFDHAEGSKINWKAGKNLTVKLVKKQSKPPRGARGKGGKAGAVRVQTVEEPCESFFLFFSPPVADKEAEDEEQDELLNDMLEADFEYGCVFKDKLIPHAALWFTGEAAEYDDYGDDMYNEDDFGDEDDEEEEDDEDDDEEEEEEEKPRKGGRGSQQPAKKGGGGGKPFAPAAGGPGQPQQPECKQQ